jgi:hypothetical protein
MKVKITFAILLLQMGLFSCKKAEEFSEESSLSKTALTSKSTKQQVDYAVTHLKNAGLEIAKAATDKNFVDFVHAEVKKKFDGEYEVLIQDLQKNTKWGNKLSSNQLLNALNQFKDIDGSNFYPQIYIPKFEANENITGVGVATPAAAPVPDTIVYVFYGGDAEADSSAGNEIYPGYIYANGGYTFYTMVNEEYANTHEVWVFSLNESVNSIARYPLPCDPNTDPNCSSGGGGGGGGGGTGCTGPDCDPLEVAPATVPFPELGHTKVNCKLERMIVKDGKESWLGGASEVSIRAKLHTHNNRELGNFYPAPEKDYKSLQASSYLGNVICKVKRKQIRRGTDIVVNYPLQTNWQSQYLYNDPIFFDFVIFEKDIWPAMLNRYKVTGRIDQRAGPSVETPQWDLFYRSADFRNEGRNRPYYTSTIVNNFNFSSFGLYYNSATVNSGAISFKIMGY